MWNRYLTHVACLLAVVGTSGGCGEEPPPPIVPAKGVVLLNGAPLPQAQVRFIPQIEYGADYIASGVTDDRGRFTLQCNGQPGACASANIVLIGEADIPQHLQSENAQRELAKYLSSLKNRPIPPQYASLVSTPLHEAVSEGNAEFKFELKR